jgi:hypothetical protein
MQFIHSIRTKFKKHLACRADRKVLMSFFWELKEQEMKEELSKDKKAGD